MCIPRPSSTLANRTYILIYLSRLFRLFACKYIVPVVKSNSCSCSSSGTAVLNQSIWANPAERYFQPGINEVWKTWIPSMKTQPYVSQPNSVCCWFWFSKRFGYNITDAIYLHYKTYHLQDPSIPKTCMFLEYLHSDLSNILLWFWKAKSLVFAFQDIVFDRSPPYRLQQWINFNIIYAM